MGDVDKYPRKTAKAAAATATGQNRIWPRGEPGENRSWGKPVGNVLTEEPSNVTGE